MENSTLDKAIHHLSDVTKNRRKATISLLSADQARIALFHICDNYSIDDALDIAFSCSEKKP